MINYVVAQVLIICMERVVMIPTTMSKVMESCIFILMVEAMIAFGAAKEQLS